MLYKLCVSRNPTILPDFDLLEHKQKRVEFLYTALIILLSFLLMLAKMSHMLVMCADPNNKQKLVKKTGK